MSYIDQNLMPGERILFRTKKHIIVFFFPAVWILIAFYIYYYMLENPILIRLAWVPWLLAIVFWAYSWFDYYFSEYAVTDKRVMMREGFFTRHTNETRLSTITQVNVDQTLFGQMLNYGTVSINTFGAFDAFPVVASPFAFQKMVNEQLDKIVR